MHTITGIGGKELERDKTKGVKVRLAETFRREGQKMTEIMGEINALSPKDFEDFAGWYNAAGYPTNNGVTA
jgi:hypothetical protein